VTYTLKFIIDVITEEMQSAPRIAERTSLAKLRQKFCEIDNELSRKETENAVNDN
jgi:hypothetical protein